MTDAATMAADDSTTAEPPKKKLGLNYFKMFGASTISHPTRSPCVPESIPVGV